MEISEIECLVVIGGFVLGSIGSIWSLESRIKRTDRRIARVEHKIDLILDHLGLRETDPRFAQVAAFLRDGKKINAIKSYREITGVGLKEAKEAVERMDS